MLQCYNVNGPNNRLHSFCKIFLTFIYLFILILDKMWVSWACFCEIHQAGSFAKSLNPYLAEANPVHDICPSATLPHTAPRSHTASVPIHFSDLHSTAPHRKQTDCRNMSQHPLNERQKKLICGKYGPYDGKQCLILTSFLSFRQEPTYTLTYSFVSGSVLLRVPNPSRFPHIHSPS